MITKLTICIPSRNRGPIALNQVRQTLPLIDSDWGILVLDNCSSVYCDEYREIEAWSKTEPRLTYFRQSENVQFPGNLLSCFYQTKSPYIQIVGDEDFSNPPVVRDALSVLDEFPEVGVIRGSIGTIAGVQSRNLFNYPDQLLAAGQEALSGFMLTTNYVSGVIYNRKLLANRGVIDRFAIGLKNNGMVAIYAHMYLDMLVASVCNVVTSKEIICYEGEEEFGPPSLQDSSNNPAYSFGGRVEQFIAFRDVLRSACKSDKEADPNLILNLYLKLCDKYAFMFVRDRYLHEFRNMNVKLLLDSFKSVALAALDIAEFDDYKDLMRAEVQKVFGNAHLYL